MTSPRTSPSSASRRPRSNRSATSTAAATRAGSTPRSPIELAGVGPWTYETLIRAQLNQGQWLVTWAPSTFHPDLTEVTTLVRHRKLPARAPILDRNGIALTPERAIVRVGVVSDKVKKATYEDLTEPARHRRGKPEGPGHRREAGLVRLRHRPAAEGLRTDPPAAARRSQASRSTRPVARSRLPPSGVAPSSGRSGPRPRSRSRTPATRRSRPTRSGSPVCSTPTSGGWPASRA